MNQYNNTRMNNIERFWHDLIDTRKHTIAEVYGAEAADRYQPHPIEMEYFVKNSGHFSSHPSVTKHTTEFFKMCEVRYEMQKLNHKRTLKQRWNEVLELPEYKRAQSERDNIAQIIKGVILAAHGKEETAHSVHPRTDEAKGR